MILPHGTVVAVSTARTSNSSGTEELSLNSISSNSPIRQYCQPIQDLVHVIAVTRLIRTLTVRWRTVSPPRAPPN